MQKIVQIRDIGSEAGPKSPKAPPSIEPIWTVVDSLSRTLDCIKSLSETVPNGPIRDRLETERANLVIGLFVARIAAMRVSSSKPAPEVSASSNSRRG